MSVVEVKGVGRSFIIPHVSRSTLLRRTESFLRGRATGASEIFWALRDISFSVQPGEVLGIMGQNGSGKSTLLKILANLLRPTEGAIRVEGRISPLLELGMSFHKQLTAEENIYLYGGYLGVPRSRMREKVDGILQFAELERFRDAKLHTFSTGMKSRLAFSVAIQVDPDILILDEVFAVGDMFFKQKCLQEMERFKEQGTTILFVSHDMGAMDRFCDRAVLLENGRLLFEGDTEEALEQYVYRSGERASKKRTAEKEKTEKSPTKPSDASVKKEEKKAAGEPESPKRWGDQRVRVERVLFLDKGGKETSTLRSGDPLRIRIHYAAPEPVADAVFGIGINTRKIRIYGINTKTLDLRLEPLKGEGALDFEIPAFHLAEGEYLLTVAVHDWNDPALVYDWIDKGFTFSVINPYPFAGTVNLNAKVMVADDVQVI